MGNEKSVIDPKFADVDFADCGRIDVEVDNANDAKSKQSKQSVGGKLPPPKIPRMNPKSLSSLPPSKATNRLSRIRLPSPAPPASKATFHRKNKSSTSAQSDQFIITLNRRQKITGCAALPRSILTEQRRLVFVSLIGLYLSWEECPCTLLYSAIFMLPLKRRWISDPNRYRRKIETESNLLNQVNIFQDQKKLKHFMDLLRWKDSQNLAFWMLDEREDQSMAMASKGGRNKLPLQSMSDYNLKHLLISPFWKHFNEKIVQIYDPVTKANYQPVNLDEAWWKLNYDKVVPSQFGVKPHRVLSELYFASLKFKPMQEILHQSNPNSFLPIQNLDELRKLWRPKLILPAHNSASRSPLNDSASATSPPHSAGFDRYGFCTVSSVDDDILHSADEHSERKQAEDDGDDDECGAWMVSIDYDENDVIHEDFEHSYDDQGS